VKTLAAAFCALSIAMLSPSTFYPQRAGERSQFRVTIHPTGERSHSCTVTNLSGKPVSALVWEMSFSSQPARKPRKVWDSLMEGRPPLEPGASLSQDLYLGHSPLPSKIEVIAAVWTDGKTFGAPADVNSILNLRAAFAADYEDAARILQQGLNQNWTRYQYQQAFRDKPDSGAVYTVRTALSATQATAQSPQEFTHTMQFLLKNFQQLSQQLRKVKPL
jgi:hypothetical protein